MGERGSGPPRRPTARQAEYLIFIRAFTKRWGIPPSFEDIGRHFMTTTPSVNGMVKTLESRGFLARIPGAARTLRVLLPEEAPRKEVPEAGGVRTENQPVETAVLTASLIVERLVPALAGAERELLWKALDAVAAALEVACEGAGATPAQRREAHATLVRVAHVAQGASPEVGPTRRVAQWTKRR
jgi:hypothetical protein